MKKLLSLVAIAAMFSLVACGPSKEEQEKAAKATADSLAAVQAKMTADSLAAVQAKMTADSLAAAQAKAAADSAAAAQAKPMKKGKKK